MKPYPLKPFTAWQLQQQRPYNRPFPMHFDDTLTQLQKMNLLMKLFELLQENFISMQEYMDAVTAFIEAEYDKNEEIFTDLKAIVNQYNDKINASMTQSGEALAIASELETLIHATRDSINNLIIHSGTSDAETIMLRTNTITGVTYSTAYDRANADYDKLNNILQSNCIYLSDFTRIANGKTSVASALKTALNMAKETGKPLFIPPTADGYAIGESVVVPYGVNIFGYNSKLITLKPLVLEGNNKINNLVFDALNLNGTHVIVNGDYVTISNNTFKNAQAVDTWTVALEIKDNVQDIHVYNNLFNVIRPAAENGIIGDAVGSSRAIVAGVGKNIVIANNVFSSIYGEEDGDYVQITTPNNDVNTRTQTDVTIIHNHFLKPTKSAVKIQASGVKVVHNHFTAGDTTTYFVRAYESSDIQINDNVFNSATVALYMAITLEGCKNVSIAKNTINMLKRDSITYAMYIKTCENIVINHNDIHHSITTVYLNVLTSKEIVIASNNLKKVSITINNVSDLTIDKNRIAGNHYEAIRFDDNTNGSLNVYITNNLAQVASRFVQLLNADKSNVNIVNNQVFFSVPDTAEFLILGAITKKNITLHGNTPARGISYGQTWQRPTFNLHAGYQYFDTDIKKMVVWNGTAWTTADGSVV